MSGERSLTGAMERRSEHPRKRGAEILAAQLRSHGLDSIQLKINGNIQDDSLAVATNFNNYFLNSVQLYIYGSEFSTDPPSALLG